MVSLVKTFALSVMVSAMLSCLTVLGVSCMSRIYDLDYLQMVSDCIWGAGGTGRSHVIKLIRCDVIYFLQQTMKVQPDEPLVLLTAPTGVAAFDIGGITLHLAFSVCSDVYQMMVILGRKGQQCN